MLCSSCLSKYVHAPMINCCNQGPRLVRSLYALIKPYLQAIGQFFKHLYEDSVDYIKNKNVFVISSHLFESWMGILDKIALISRVFTLPYKDREEIVLSTAQIIKAYGSIDYRRDDIRVIINLVASLPKEKRSSIVSSVAGLVPRYWEEKMNLAKYLLIFALDNPQTEDQILNLTVRLMNLLDMSENPRIIIRSIISLPSNQRELLISGIEQLCPKPLPIVYSIEPVTEVIDLFSKVLTTHGEGIISFLKGSLNYLNLELKSLTELNQFLQLSDSKTVFSKQSLALLKDIVNRIGINDPTLVITILKKMESIDKTKVETVILQATSLVALWPSSPSNLSAQKNWLKRFDGLLTTLNDFCENLIKERMDRILLYGDALKGCTSVNSSIEQFFIDLLRIPTDSPPPSFNWRIHSATIPSNARQHLLTFKKLADFQKKIPKIIYTDSPAINAGGITRDLITKIFHALCSQKNLKFPGELTDGFVFPKFSDDSSLHKEEIACFEALGTMFNYALTRTQDILIGQYFHPLLFELIYDLSQTDINHMISSPLPFDTPSPALQPIYDKLLKKLLPQKYPAIFETIAIVDRFVDNGKVPPDIQDTGIHTKKEFIKASAIDLSLAAVCCIARSFPPMSPQDWSEFKGKSFLEFSEKIQGSLSKELLLQNMKWELGEGVNDDDKNRIEGFFIQWIMDAEEKLLKDFIQAISSNTSLSPHQKFSIRLYPNGEDIPSFHTCSMTVDIPSQYPTYEWFKEKLESSLLYLKKMKWDFHFS
ncbi:MAG: hypothetical protein Q8L98_02840 [Chlamydiales bacterium]|nr:hypothetical protein [Chlamydiales bacterium]